METVGASYLGAFLGVSVTSVQNWRKEDGNGFPEPVTCVRGLFSVRSVYGWEKNQLAEARIWYAERFHLDEEKAQERWRGIDESLKAGRLPSPVEVPSGQLTFSIPVQRTGEVA
jgi:hypothetical protein